jgi:hypothetical protein
LKALPPFAAKDLGGGMNLSAAGRSVHMMAGLHRSGTVDREAAQCSMS